jgi:hypothetical protein
MRAQVSPMHAVRERRISDQAAAVSVGTSRPARTPSPYPAALVPVIKDDSLCRPIIVWAQRDGDARAVIKL